MVDKTLIVQNDPYSSVSETFRTLRTNIQFMNVEDNKNQIILITSTAPGDGKSWVSSNIAVAFAQAGKKTCLVDVDLRKGRVASIFNINPVPGVSNYLTGVNINAEQKEVVRFMQSTKIKNLFVIPGGNLPPNPSELLASKKMKSLLDELKELVDVIILDGTPCSLVTDASIVSRIVDQTIIVSCYNVTKSEDLKQTKKSIENAGGKVSGIILNKKPITKKKYEASYYYSGFNNKAEKEMTVCNSKKSILEKIKGFFLKGKSDSKHSK